MTITRTAHDHYKAALALRNRILDGAVNETPVQAWAAVARECAKAEDAFRRENEGRVHGRSQQAFLTNLDRVAWYARAQVETIARAGR